jgi:hypothetical protein
MRKDGWLLCFCLLVFYLSNMWLPHNSQPRCCCLRCCLTAGPCTPVAGLYCCGDSRFPGIGLPAVAASGAICANTLVPVWQHWQLLDELAV